MIKKYAKTAYHRMKYSGRTCSSAIYRYFIVLMLSRVRKKKTPFLKCKYCALCSKCDVKYDTLLCREEMCHIVLSKTASTLTKEQFRGKGGRAGTICSCELWGFASHSIWVTLQFM